MLAPALKRTAAAAADALAGCFLNERNERNGEMYHVGYGRNDHDGDHNR